MSASILRQRAAQGPSPAWAARLERAEAEAARLGVTLPPAGTRVRVAVLTEDPAFPETSALRGGSRVAEGTVTGARVSPGRVLLLEVVLDRAPAGWPSVHTVVDLDWIVP